MSFSPRSRNFSERHLDNDRGTSLRMFSRHSRISKFSSRPSSWGRSIREMPLSWRVFRVTRKGFLMHLIMAKNGQVMIQI